MTETYSLISQEPRERDPILDPTGANRLDGDDVAIGFNQYTGDLILCGHGAIGTKRGVQSAVTTKNLSVNNNNLSPADQSGSEGQ
jgi:hypothetical protein